ncbi:MAG: helix-turn-helix domain-containing protein [Clostridia bacterium]|nr:helix-turn-helix domain-containing protein [Clostridia bacterium]
MNTYITAKTIKRLREEKGLTQFQLAEIIGVSDKAVSKWETSKGLPDISLVEPLCKALGVSVMELMSGDTVINKNISSNLLRSKFYVCPVCGNVMHSMGEAVISCCGIILPVLEAEEPDEEHTVTIEPVEDEKFITVHHSMTKEHFISFIAYVTSDTMRIVKLYPEGNAETRMQFRGRGYLYIYCNRHGLMKIKV